VSAKPLHYFAYGSNLLTSRLKARTPSARPVGIATLPGWQLHFHKVGSDGSGKGDIVPAADAVVTGVIYRLRARELWRLDLAEGAGYRRRRIAVCIGERWHRCETYVATHTDPELLPYDWYRALILAGLLEHDVRGPMLDQVLGTPSLPDPRRFRSARLRALRALQRFSSQYPTLAETLLD
jgi:hypothetical protein